MDMTSQRWDNTKKYLNQVFGAPTGNAPLAEQLRTLMPRAVAAGLPDIAVSGDVGALLRLLTMMACGDSASRGKVLELGTLAGYSGIWIALGLPADGRLITIEFNPVHAEFAKGEFRRAGVGEKVRVITGAALDVLPSLAQELGPGSLDLVFIDAIKTEYNEYLRLVRPLLRRGGLLVIDNALGSGHWWIDDAPGDPSHEAVDRMNRAVAADAGFAAACVPSREGVMIARKL